MSKIQPQKAEQIAKDLIEELDQPIRIGKALITPAEGIVRSCIREGIRISDKDWVLAEMASVSGGSFSPGEAFPQPEAVKKALEKYWPEIVGKLKKAAKQVEQQMATEDNALLGWKYLVTRKHSWRRQAYIKGSNMTVGQLISIIKTNNLTPSEAPSNLRLPLEAIEEALRYYEQNRTLIEQEAEKERRRLKKKGYTVEPQDLPR